MSEVGDELMLLERVFLRLGSAQSDDQLENVLLKFLPPVLLKLMSPHETVRKKVMELLIHVNKRIKNRSQINLPFEALLLQYANPACTSFVINFTIIYIKLGYPRLTSDLQLSFIPKILSALNGKPQSHLDSLLLMVVQRIAKISDFSAEKNTSGFDLRDLKENRVVAGHLLNLMRDILLLPYGNVALISGQQVVPQAPPPGMSTTTFRKITDNISLTAEQLEDFKLGIIRFLAQGYFTNEDIYMLLIIAAADTRFNVVNLADMELKKVLSELDWSSSTISSPLFSLFLGSTVGRNVKPDDVITPANVRIRLKLLTYLGRVQGDGLIVPSSMQVIFDSLYGNTTNTKLKTLALGFTLNLLSWGDKEQVSKVGPVLLSGMQKLTKEGEDIHKGQAFIIIGQISVKFPHIVRQNVALINEFFEHLEANNSTTTNSGTDIKLQIREGFLNLISAYTHLDQFDNNSNVLFALARSKLNSNEQMVRYVLVKMLSNIFPNQHIPSKYLLLLLTGDCKEDVRVEAQKALYDQKPNQLPNFADLVTYIFHESEQSVKQKKHSIGTNFLAFDPDVYLEIILYLRACLLRDLDSVPFSKQVLCHPCQYTPLIRRYLDGKFPSESTLSFFQLIQQLMLAKCTVTILNVLIELVGCIPVLVQLLINDGLVWLRNELKSSKEEVRNALAELFALIMQQVSIEKYQREIQWLIDEYPRGTLEFKHGTVMALSNAVALKQLLAKKNAKNETCCEKAVLFLNSIFNETENPLLLLAVCGAFGQLGRSGTLPLDDGTVKSESPVVKKPNTNDNGKLTKFDLVEKLFGFLTSSSSVPGKVKEKAAGTLGLICVGEMFPHTRYVMETFLGNVTLTKDVEMHFTIGESLVMCCKSGKAPETRDFWSVLPEEAIISKGNCDDLDEFCGGNLTWLLDELLKLSKQIHPNSKQACCIWLLAVVKDCIEMDGISEKIDDIQVAFMNFLCDSNDIVQDAASKGLCILYDKFKSPQLLDALVKQLTSGTRHVVQVSNDTKLFEAGQLGKTPTGGDLTTYKELCSLASDLNKPDLIYQFMQLANHNAVWNSKKGAAFGFSTIAAKCHDHLREHLPVIVPKLYRYQFDPVPTIQVSMHNIWKILVTETQKTLEQYFDEILRDLLDNLNSSQYRVRQSCCMALQDLLKGAGNKSVQDCGDNLEILWSRLFRVMDDHHEATRLQAIKTAQVISRLCVRACDQDHGKAGERMIQAVLPIFLTKGITSSVAEIRLLSLQTVSELVDAAGKQLKPHLPKLIPALLEATSELESRKLSQLSVMLGSQAQAQEIVDNTRASIAKSHFTTKTVIKTLQYADGTILAQLCPNIVDLMRSSAGLGTRIACSHFITLLVTHLAADLKPYVGKFMSILVQGLCDRNGTIRKNYANTIGYLVALAKDTTVEKLFEKLKVLYYEREDDSIRSACAYTVYYMGMHSSECFKDYASVAMPLVFFAMHAEKTPDTENTLQLWTDIWMEHSLGYERGAREHLDAICEYSKNALASASWSLKAQGANTICTLAKKLGTSMPLKHRNDLLEALLASLSGRTWNGKENLLKAVSKICSNCIDPTTIATTSQSVNSQIVDVMIRESKKSEISYKIHAIKYLGDVCAAVECDRFETIYDELIKDLICGQDNMLKTLDLTVDETVGNRENCLKLQESAYETLGKIWPKNHITQNKYDVLFIEHCYKYLPLVTRSVQASVMAALYQYVEKLMILDETPIRQNEKLMQLVDGIFAPIKYALDIKKYTKIRKEALNILLILYTKIRAIEGAEELTKSVSIRLNELLPDLVEDREPEIKSRVIQIKNLLLC